jgi:type IV pilus assembly protein PilF
MKHQFSNFLVAAAALAALPGCVTVDPSRDTADSGMQQKELATRSDRSENQKRAGIRLQLAVGYYEQRQFEVALDEIKQALQADPDLADAFSMRALIYTEMGENRLAKENFQRALQLSPGNPEYLNNYGWFLCQRGQEEQALKMFDAVLKDKAYQSPSKALTNAGLCSARLKDFSRAEKYLQQSFQYEPANLVTNFHLANVYYQQGNDDRARFYISRVLQAGAATAEALWLAIKVERRLGNAAAVSSLGTQLRRRYPDSSQYAAYQRGAYHE